jgi:RHS repeat-associated protein
MTWSKSYISSGDRVFSVIRNNGSGGETTDLQHYDRLGVRLITNQATGSSLEQQALPFGTPLENETTGSTNRRFTSYDRSNVTGLDYAQNRTYDAQQGRFTQVDPIGMLAASLDNPQSLNLYAYVGNDPVNRTDPSGLFWGKLFRFLKKLLKIIMIAAAVAVAIIATATFFGAPTWAAFFAMISAGATAASQITGALGLTGVSKVLKIIGALADIANATIKFVEAIKTAAATAAKTAGAAVQKAVLEAIRAGITLATKVLDFFAVSKISGVFKVVNAALKFYLDGKLSFGRGERSKWRYAMDIFKLGRGIASQIASFGGLKQATRFIDLLGIVDDVDDIVTAITKKIDETPTVKIYTFLSGGTYPIMSRKLFVALNVIQRASTVLGKSLSIPDRIIKFAQ